MKHDARTILIVDDEATNRKLLDTLLRAEGYLTVLAADGAEALTAVAERRPDLILLDVMMPAMDGYDVAATLKACAETANIPIIMVSAHHDRDARLAGLTAGAEEYVTKPIDRAELYLRVRNLLRLKDLSDSLNAQSVALEQEVQARTADLQQLAHFDGLTGLPNRSLFHERLSKQLGAPDMRDGTSVGVMFIDIDHFKNVNDSLGHGSGDVLLRAVAERLTACVRTHDTVGRLGGDEFGLTLRLQNGPRDAAAVAAKVGAALRRPFDVDGSEVIVSASIGIALHPGDGSDPDTLIQYADTAMYRAKESGRDRFRFFTAQMNADLRAQLEMEIAIRHAVERDEFVLHYQPKVDLGSGRVCGVEALLRWARPGHGLVSPAEFIPILESTGLIVRVGSWVLAEATAQIARWLRSDVGPMPIAVNVSGRQFIDGDIDLEVAAALAANAVPASLLEIELTESTLMEHTERTAAELTKLRARGVRISVDDFGTGYSSLAYLRRFPIDTLKIDRAFVQEITTNADDAAIALTIIRLAHGLNLNVVAEGVETAAQAAFLREQACDQMQGFLFSRPLPAADLERLLRDGAGLYANDSQPRATVGTAVGRSSESSTDRRSKMSESVAANPAVTAVLESLQWANASVHTIAAALAQTGTCAPSGRRWTPKSVQQLLSEYRVADAVATATPQPPALFRHDVHVYRDDTDLAQRVSVYLARALHQGASCLVIATPEHRSLVRSALGDLGLGDVLVRPRFIELDAEELLAAFMRDGLPVAELFDQVVLPFLAGAPSSPPVHGYGEMVDILWRAGNISGAIQLEDLWGDLQRRTGFELLCAYAAESVHGTTDGIEGLRARHSHVTGSTDPQPTEALVAVT